MLRSDGLVTPDTQKRLFEPRSSLGGRNRYGLGFYLTTIGERRWFGHTGSDPGVSARVAFDVVSDSSIVVLCNVEAAAFAVFRRIVESCDANGMNA
ncbi:MAG: serine hydrolase [Pirellulales bacterium]